MIVAKRLYLLFVWLLSGVVVSALAAERDAPMNRVDKLNQPWTGDLDGMVERRQIRALVTHNKMFYFLDKGTQRGASYDLLKEFEEFVNKKNKTGTLRIDVLFVPVNRDQLLPALLAGKGDIAAANLTITDTRSELVDFSKPFLTGVREILVAGRETPPVGSLAGLSGREIYVRRSSSYYESLTRLNERLQQQDRPPVLLRSADEHLEDSDLLEMVNAGLIPMVIVDSHKAQFWRDIFTDIRVHDDIAINEGGQIAWAFRKNSPQLARTVNEFVTSHKKGTLLGNVLYKRYLQENKWVRNALSEQELTKFRNTLALFRKYGGQYDFDWVMVAAQAYQESGLDHSKRSAAGAVGIMQVLPSTAADPNIAIANVEKLEPNIHAGTKYLRFIQDRYFAADSLDAVDRYLFTFAAYNAGPAKINRLRAEAAEMGLSPDRWFDNVEVVAANRIGRETVQYVRNIYKYYIAYRLVVDKVQLRQPQPAV